MISNWVRWHFMHARLFFVLLFKGKITEDIKNMNNNVSLQKIRGGEPTANEHSEGTAYQRFKDHFGEIKRMNGYFWTFIILYAIGYGFWQSIGAPGKYTEGRRGVDCPPDSGFWDCLNIYIDRFTNIPLLFLMVLILAFVMVVGSYEMMRRRGEGVSEKEYDEGKAWLKKVSEEPRKLTPWLLLLVLMLFLLLEAAAITIIASSFVADFTRTTETWVGVFVGIVCASALGWLVHHAGAQLYRNKKRERLNATLDADDKEISRVLDTTERPSYSFLTASVIVVLGLVVLAFMQRYNLNMEILEDQVNVATQESLFGDDVPSDILDIQDKNQQELVTHSSKRQEQGLIAALSVLSVIFILVNGIGCGIGYKYSFICDKSEHAYKNVRTFEKWKKSEGRFKADIKENNEKLYRKADNFFAKYFSCLVKEANRAKREQDIPDALATRDRYTMVRFENEEWKERDGSA